MSKAEYIKNTLAGLFFIAGIALLFVFILTLGKDKGITESKFQLPVIFYNVGGLSEGSPVLLNGVTVGGVHEIGFISPPIDGRRVLVKLNIFEKYQNQFKYPMEVAIQTEGVLGEKIVQIKIKEEVEQELDLSKPLIGIDPLDVTDIADAFSKAAESFTKTATELGDINMVELADVMQESSKALLITSEGINEIMVELQEIAFKSKRIFDRLEEKLIEGELFKVF